MAGSIDRIGPCLFCFCFIVVLGKRCKILHLDGHSAPEDNRGSWRGGFR
jgi:hypothetical protein